MSNYEFSQKDNETLSGLAKVMKQVGWLWIALGIVAVISNIVTGFDSISESLGGFVFAGFTAGFGVLLLRPIDNLENVANTKGNDIREMMTAVTELASGFKIVNLLFLIGIVAYILAVVILGS